MSTGTQTIYQNHNQHARDPGFSILKEERGAVFAREIGTNKKVLDLGCRDGILTQTFVKENDVTGADIDAIALKKAADTLHIKTIHLDLNDTWDTLKGQQFNAVVMAETLEHLYYPEQVIEKVKALVTPDGLFIGSVPNAFSAKNRVRLFLGHKEHTPLADPTHINHFRYDELKELFAKHFTSVKIVPLGTFATYDHLWPGMFAFDLVWVCRGKK